jgi:hypothetical protein
MKKQITLLVLISAVSTFGLDEFGYFSRTSGSASWNQNSVVLESGDAFTILSFDSSNFTILLDVGDGSPKHLDSAILVGRDHLATTDSAYGFSYPAEQRTIVGPATISINSTDQSYPTCYIAYKISRAETSVSPANIISLPADSNGNIELIFESSTDLQTWESVYSFTYNSANQSHKFFRTRLIKVTTE